MPLILLSDWKERKLRPDGSLCQSQFYPKPTGKKSDPSTHCRGRQTSPLPCKQEAFFPPCFLKIAAITYNRIQELSFMRTTGCHKTICNTTFLSFYSSNLLSFGRSHRCTMTGAAPSTWFVKKAPHCKAEGKHFDGSDIKLGFHK